MVKKYSFFTHIGVFNMQPSNKPSSEVEKIIVRSYPKVVTLLPTAVLAIIFGTIESIPFIGTLPSVQKALGLVFVLFLIFNVFIIAFEFNEAKTFGLITIVVILVLVYLLLAQLKVVPGSLLIEALLGVEAYLSSHAYFLVGFGFLFTLFLIWLSRRWDYWIIEPNQITHHRGIFGKIERYPTHGMKYSIEISDIFEYALFRSGTLVLYFPSERKMISLPLVPNIKRVERHIQELLGIIEVEEEE